jgi:hypothetical protein
MLVEEGGEECVLRHLGLEAEAKMKRIERRYPAEWGIKQRAWSKGHRA